ncbi:hypothetical protein ACFQ1L_09300 [Phytohabitans flavus]
MSFTEKEARRLLKLKGVTDERVVKTIIAVSGRLPLLVALLAESRPRDPSDVGDPSGPAVERFLKWEGNPQRREAALLGALPRRVDADILGVLTGVDDARTPFRWLCALPFVAARAGRYEYHDIVRSPMIRIQRTQSPKRWRESHSRLAAAHEAWRNSLGANNEWLNAEWFYHRSEESYHRLCLAADETLPESLILAVAAAKSGASAARRWAEMLRDAGRDADHLEVVRWGERLLAAVDDQSQECSEYLTELLTDAPLSSLARVEALVERGRLYYATDREAAALMDLTEAIRTDPTISKAWESKSEAIDTPISISVDAYLDTDDDAVGQKVLAALDELADLLGYEGPIDEQTFRGSIWRRALATLRGRPSSSEVRDRLARVERALVLSSLEMKIADVDSKTASAVEQLIVSLTNVPEACLRVGSLLVIKYQDVSGPIIVARSLSVMEVRALERYPEIQTDPKRALQSLAVVADNILADNIDLGFDVTARDTRSSEES